MIDAPTQTLLHDIIRRESRSLLQYIDEAFPWTSPTERAALGQLRQLVNEERRGAGALVRLLARGHVQPPHLGSYPEAFTAINYLSLEHLIPMLLDHQRRAISDLERDLTCLYDPEAREQVQKILDMKRRHLAELERMKISGAAAQASTV